MRIIIDVNALISEGIIPIKSQPGAIDAVWRLSRADHSITYYTRNDITLWIEEHCPPGDIVVYNDVIDKLETLYERNHNIHSVTLIEARWQETLDAFGCLLAGEVSHRVPHWRSVSSFLFAYLRLIAFGDGPVPLCGGMFPATLRLLRWEDVETVLALVSDHDKQS